MLKRCFHSSAASLGRKTGASAFVAGPRNLSKKQKKRNVTRLKARAAVIDQKKEKIKSRHEESQINSQEMIDMIRNMNAKLDGAFQDLLLPDGIARLDVGEEQPLRITNEDPMLTLYILRDLKVKHELAQIEGRVPLADPLKRSETMATSNNLSSMQSLEQSYSFAPAGSLGTDIDKPSMLTEFQTNRALTGLSRMGKFKELSEMVSTMKEMNLAIESSTWALVIATCSRRGRHKLAEDYFDIMLECGVEPTPFTWTALVQAKARGRGTDAALEQIDILKRTGVTPTSHMFNVCLQILIDENKHDAAEKLWIRMHWEDFNLTKESFTTMMRMCVKKGCPERAFFYMDEMRQLDIEPSIQTFLLLFRSCAEAPHWVDGYHDIIFDAMAKMEGAELTPDARIYNAIIYAFSRGGDTVAAEFYFWEMKRKGLRPTNQTYGSLLYAYAKSNTIGAEAYGSAGRYARPAPPAPTQEEQDRMDIGATRVAQMMASGLTQEVDVERGSRQKGKLEDMLDEENPEALEAFEAEIRMEAAHVRNIRAKQIALDETKLKTSILMARDDYVPPEFEPMGIGNLDFEEMSKTDPELRKLMMQIEEDNMKYSDEHPDEDEDEDENDVDDEVEDRDKDIDDRGYDEGEKQYKDWAMKHDMEEDDDDVIDESEILSADTYKEKFTAEDKNFFENFDLPSDDEFDEDDAEADKMARKAMGMSMGVDNDKDDDADADSDSEEGIKEMIDSDQLAALLKDLGFDKDMDEQHKTGDGKSKRQDVVGGGRFRPREDYDHVAKVGMRGAANRLSEYETNDKLFDKNRRGDMDGEIFRNPFSTTSKKPQSMESIESEGRKNELMSLLDNEVPEEVTAYERKTRVPTSTHVREADGSFSYMEKKQHSYKDGKEKAEIKLFSDYSPQEIDDQWDMIEFGRAPNPDYSMSVSQRRAENIKRATLVFQDLAASKVPVDVVTLTTYMTVFCNAVDKKDRDNNTQKALDVFDTFPKYGLKPDIVTYRGMIKMYILGKDIHSAIELKENMIKQGLVPDAESYGMIIQSCGHRDLLVEGLKMLEEVTERGIYIPERHLRHLRSRCETLGIVHPDMPKDPIAWVADMKKMRRDGKHRSQRKIEPIRSALYSR